MTLPSANAVVSFWREAGPEKWFAKDEAFDAEIIRRFLPAHEAAAAGKLGEWEETPEMGGVYIKEELEVQERTEEFYAYHLR